MKRKILLYGTSTYKNRGVEAIVNSTINQIDKKSNDITIACFDVDYNNKFYKDRVKHINQYRKDSLTKEEKQLEKEYQKLPFDYRNFELLYQKDVVQEMKKSDICISIGGDNYCYQPCNWLYAVDSKSHELGKKTVLWGASLFDKIDDLELIQNLNNFDVLVIRESLTLNAIKDYVDKDKIIFEKDPAFSLKIKRVKRDPWYDNNKYIVFNVSPLTIKDEKNYEAVITFMNYILDQTNYSICLLPHVTTEDCSDLEILSTLDKEFEMEERVYLEQNNYNCEELKYIISQSKFAVVARTHASIAAYSTFVPTLVIGYSVKSRGIAKDLFGNYENYVINREDLEGDKLVEKFKWIENNKYRIIKKLKQQMPGIVKNSSHIFEKVIKKLEEQEKKRICNPKDCINCNLCKNVCPVNAVETVETDLHFKYNQRKVNMCINCGKCLNICPTRNDKKKNNNPLKCYAAKNKDEDVQKQSTSGGVFTALANYILQEKGIVYGAQRQNEKTSHIRVSKRKDLEKIRGSKYSYSKLDGILEQIVKDAKANKKILFSGTPCQVAAMKMLLKKYKNVYYVSVICHGVLNDDLVSDYCKKNKLNLISFRTKEKGWYKSCAKYDKYVKELANDNFLSLYINNLILRDSCYQCKFKLENNLSDIILGDYWGIKELDSDFFDDNGVSAVIINSKTGDKLFNQIKTELIYKETTIDSIKTYNPSINSSPSKPIGRFSANKLLKESDWKAMITENEIDSLKREIQNLKENMSKKEYELNSIKNSKRWKLVDKMMRAINKVLRRS